MNHSFFINNNYNIKSLHNINQILFFFLKKKKKKKNYIIYKIFFFFLKKKKKKKNLGLIQHTLSFSMSLCYNSYIYTAITITTIDFIKNNNLHFLKLRNK